MKPSRPVVVWGALAALVLSAPFLFRLVPFFEVRRIELAGVRYIERDSIIARMALERDQNLFAPTGVIEDRVRALPGVVDVHIERELPATMRVHVIEEQPVALAPGPEGMVPLNIDGHPLPYRPERAAPDLPVVERASRELAHAVALVGVVDFELYQELDGARLGASGMIVLEVGSQRLLFRGVPLREDLRRVLAVRRHLLNEARQFNELDARYTGWVVARNT